MRKLIIIAAIAALAIPANGRIFQKKKKQSEPAKVEAPAQQLAPVTDVLNGEWTIRQVGTTQINAEENAPYVYFELSQDAFYANNGCNVLNGIFTIEDGCRITFHNVLSTMRYCSDTPYDTEINSVLADEKTVVAKYRLIAGEGYLDLCDNSGRTLMILRRHALDFLNGKWRVTEINGETFDNDEMNIFFDINERKIHGNTGCNFFNGDIFIDPNRANTISLSDMGVTQRACPDGDTERKMLVALEQATTVLNTGNDTVMLSDGSGSVIKLARMPLTPTQTDDDQ